MAESKKLTLKLFEGNVVVREISLSEFVGKVNLKWYPAVMQKFLGWSAADDIKRLEEKLAAAKKAAEKNS